MRKQILTKYNKCSDGIQIKLRLIQHFVSDGYRACKKAKKPDPFVINPFPPRLIIGQAVDVQVNNLVLQGLIISQTVEVRANI